MKKSALGPSSGTACPCGSGQAYADCCGRYHAGLPAPDAEALMRSRYSAYVFGLEDYLLATWHPDTRPATLDLADDAAVRWLGLEVRRHESPAAAVDAGGAAIVAFVEFVARCRRGGRAQRLHERSRFLREDGRWHYVDGEFPDAGRPR
ncbi:MAG: YchJ family protein [Proteobacteria bacterium]|nr:YchJ family protein [Pseudomonadota bacterium]